MHGRRASGSVYSQAMAGCDSVSFYVTLLNPNLYINAEVIGDDLEVSPLLFGHPCVLVSPRTQETWKRKIMFTCSSNLQWNFLIFITPPPSPIFGKKSLWTLFSFFIPMLWMLSMYYYDWVMYMYSLKFLYKTSFSFFLWQKIIKLAV